MLGASSESHQLDTGNPAETPALTPLAPVAAAPRPGVLTRFADRWGISRRSLIAGILLPIAAVVVVLISIGVAPADQRVAIVLSAVVAAAAGLSSTAIGVYGGVLVP